MSRTRKHETTPIGRACSLCERFKVWDDFYTGAGTNGRDTRCKECMKDKTRVRNRLPEVRAAESERWQTRWETANPGLKYAPRSPGVSKAIRNRRLFYGVSGVEYALLEQMAVFGPGLCDLHGGPETMTYRRHGGAVIRGLSIDHDHACGRHVPARGCKYCVRGLVCCECNRTILRMADKWPELAKRFSDYLERRPLLMEVRRKE